MQQKLRFLLLQTVFFLCVLITGCSSEKSESVRNVEVINDSEAVSTEIEYTEEVAAEKQIQVEINGTTLTARLEDNSSADALYEKLEEGDITVQMSDYSNFEKVGSLGFDLPTNDTQITTKAGDIILYQGDQLVFYYDTNSWSFTKLGEFLNVNQKELKELFGEDGITAVLSIRN